MIDPGLALLGLGAAGDIFGGISAYSQQKRQRDLYNQMLQYNNPANVLARQQQYFQANMGALQPQMQNILRSEVNPMIGMKGIDPASGQGQLIYNQAIAPHIMNAWNQAGNQAQGGLNALQAAGGQVGTPYGSMGGTANALQSLMLLQALKGRGGGSEMATNAGGAAPSSTTWSGGMPAYNPTGFGGRPMQLQTDPYFSDPYGAGFMFGNTAPTG